MKYKRKILTAFFFLAFWVCAACALDGCYSAGSTNSDGTFKYYSSSMENFVICGYEGTLQGELIIPETFDDKPVTGIAEGAFRGAGITGVTIHKDINLIADNAFYNCKSLVRVTVDENNKSFCSVDGILYDKAKTELILFPDGNETENFVIPESVTTLRKSAFNNCFNLKEVETHPAVDDIDIAFRFCQALENIKVSEADTRYSSADGVLYNKDFTELIFCCNARKSEYFTVPQSVDYIRLGAFKGVKTLKEMSIGFIGKSKSTDALEKDTHFGYIFGAESYEENGRFMPDCLTAVNVTGGTIAEHAFSGCDKIVTVDISDGVEINKNSFADCSSLENMKMHFTDGGYEVYFGNLFSGEYPSDRNDYNSRFVPSSLKSVMITGKTVPSGAFYNCNDLQRITLTSGITDLGGGAFAGCKNISEINYGITESEDTQLSGTFSGAGVDSERVVVNIAANVKRLPKGIFSGLGKLNEINFAEVSACEYIDDKAFGCPLYMPELTVPDSVTHVGLQAFGLYKLHTSENYVETLNVGSGVTKWLGESIHIPAIKDFPNLKVLNYNAAELSTDKYIFQNMGCDGEGVTLNIGAAVTKIPDGLFYGTNVTEINFDEGCPLTIGSQSFRSVAAETVELSDRVTYIGDRAFKDCGSLKWFTVCAATENLSRSTFEGCPIIENVHVDGEGNYSTIDGVLFNGDGTELIYYPVGRTATKYVVPDGVKTIGGSSFRDCAAIESVVFPEGLKAVKGLAFDNCAALKSVVLPDGLDEMVYCAFGDCPSLESAIVPKSVRLFGTHTFEGCPKLKIYYEGNEDDERRTFLNGQKPAEYDVPLLLYSETDPFAEGEERVENKYWHWVEGENGAQIAEDWGTNN